jgi:modulator of FtsH protease HflC
MKNSHIIGIVVFVAICVGFYASVFIVDETQQVVVTQFGRVVGESKTDPGLYFRVPFIQRVNYFPKNIQSWDGEPGQIPTLDKTYLWVDTFARWRVVDPIAFFRTVTDQASALNRLSEIINPAVRNALTSHQLIETVRNSNRRMTSLENIDIADSDAIIDPDVKKTIQTGREKLTQQILKASQPKLVKFGIELLDVKLKRVNYVKKVRDSVYGRMIAERKQMAEKIRSEGQGEAQKIAGDKEKDLKGIQSEAYRKAQEIKGKADAEATRIYAEAYSVDPEFYTFTKALTVYQSSLSKKTRMVLSTENDFLKYLNRFSLPSE